MLAAKDAANKELELTPLRYAAQLLVILAESQKQRPNQQFDRGKDKKTIQDKRIRKKIQPGRKSRERINNSIEEKTKRRFKTKD